ncbi:DUF3558 domain-containing protein [Amycolatopsis sacchari]|uniref:DUF3558 domain-containing protein n=2 Tax=Amycolatopsis TaxID=1813 RepID=UPI000B86DC0E|nr:DUF3558 domain-containing protein [Amycolatopsis sacchari]
MRSSGLLLLAVAASVLALAAACTDRTGGSPLPPATSATSAPTAPKVSNPLPALASYSDKPCELVPPSLISQLGYSDPEPSAAHGPLGPGCGWIDVRTAHGKNLNVAVGVIDGKGDGGIARVQSLNGSLYGFVEPTEISGYPAAYADTTDRRGQGKCALVVGVTDDSTFSVDTDGYSGQQDSCAAAEQVAAAVITTLQGGS